jgi:hypothetical protein
MMQVPLPDADSTPINEGAAIRLQPGERGTITVEPEKQGSLHRVPYVALDWMDGATYEVVVDGTERYAESPVPPVDLDAPTVPFQPALRLTDSMELIVRDLRASGDERLYRARVIGWEVQ